MRSAFLALFLGLILTVWATPGAAITTINAQPTTVCDSGTCETRVELSEFLNNGLITALKAIDLTPAKPVITARLLDFDYSFEGTQMVFRGRVAGNVYWTFDLGNGYVIDPWWNTTTSSVDWLYPVTGYSTNTPGNDDFGVNLTLFYPATKIEVLKYNSDSSAFCELYDVGGATWVGNESYIGDLCTITGTFAAGDYRLQSGGYANAYYNNSMTYPKNSTNNKFKVTSCTIFNAPNAWTACGGTQIFTIMQINVTASSTSSLWWEGGLELNGTSANITLDNATALNITAYNNVTLNMTIYRNGTAIGWNISRFENSSYLPAGLYNVTAWIGNASTNLSVTYFANMTYTPPLNATIGSTICTDNQTLAHINEFNPYTDNLNTYYELCPYGCDNVTYACSPPAYMTNGLVFGIFLLIIVAAWRFLK